MKTLCFLAIILFTIVGAYAQNLQTEPQKLGQLYLIGRDRRIRLMLLHQGLFNLKRIPAGNHKRRRPPTINYFTIHHWCGWSDEKLRTADGYRICRHKDGQRITVVCTARVKSCSIGTKIMISPEKEFFRKQL